jgi:L-histidine N-alpha-methyltransferase
MPLSGACDRLRTDVSSDTRQVGRGPAPQVRPRSASRQVSAFAGDVRRGLTASPKRLPSKYFYDALGSALFDAICALPWYRITRAERALIEQHGAAIGARLADPAFVVELGPGNGDKLARLARAIGPRTPPAHLHLIDVSAAALASARQALVAPGTVTVTAHRGTYEAGLRRAPRDRPGGGSTLVLLLGSNIGNSGPPAAVRLLRSIRSALRPGDWLLLGADLVKPEPELLLAYDDPLGVTAAFNKNVLQRINRQLGADFDLTRFTHRAIWRPDVSCVEMHLVSRHAQAVAIPAADCVVSFDADEIIHTESSYKYRPESIDRLGERAGFSPETRWTDDSARFALTLFKAV